MIRLTIFEKIICEIDSALRTLSPPIQRLNQRVSPGQQQPNPRLTHQEKKHVAGLMRVNHAGEVCAQALYQGQAFSAQLPHVREQMEQAAEEEIDHLAWCETRLQELHNAPSLLNPLWYIGSFILGSTAGLAGDRWSLGFVAETEKQVSTHLKHHLEKLPSQDEKSRAILEQMYEDEMLHAETAIKAGAAKLPFMLKWFMKGMSKLMTHSSYYI